MKGNENLRSFRCRSNKLDILYISSIWCSEGYSMHNFSFILFEHTFWCWSLHLSTFHETVGSHLKHVVTVKSNTIYQKHTFQHLYSNYFWITLTIWEIIHTCIYRKKSTKFITRCCDESIFVHLVNERSQLKQEVFSAVLPVPYAHE